MTDHTEVWSRGTTPHPRSGWQSRVPDYISTGASERSYPMSEVRGGSQEEQPHIQGAVAARAQEGPEELLHVQGQEGRP